MANQSLRLGAALSEALNLKNAVRIELDISHGREELKVTFAVVDKSAEAILETIKRFDIVERPEPPTPPAAQEAA
jgi:hypothetical protein